MKIAIAGYGVEGKASFSYWHTPEHELTIVDERASIDDLPEGVTTILGEGAFQQLNGFDMVVRTASLPPQNIITEGKIWSATNEFFAKCPAPIIGVTGTKGKGTTASLIASIFEAAGKTVWLLGNIGKPALEVLSAIEPDHIVVYELSSFQLWDIEKSPQAAVVLLIEPDHLNIHRDFDDYVDAKANIRRFQKEGDICVYHPTNEYSKQIVNASQQGKTVRYAIPDDGGVYIKEDAFYMSEHKICSVEALQLIGQHNIENACAAISVAKYYDIDDKAIERGLQQFKGLPHRIEFVRELDGVRYYNDSFSSAPSATIAALKSFTQPEIVILGGTDKGADFSELVRTISEQPNIKTIICIGEIRQKLADLIQNVSSELAVEIANVQDLQSIVELAESFSAPGDVILLSPACASFDMFKNFYDRGDQFRNIVNQL